MGIELEQRERSVGGRRGAQQRQGDGVVAAEAEDTCALPGELASGGLAGASPASAIWTAANGAISSRSL